MENKIIEKEVVINGQEKIAATLAVPNNNKTRHPAILIVNGSGGADRNGNQFGFKMNTYKCLSDYLVALGFVTLRYDKRGIGKSEGDGASAGMWDLIEDVKSNVEYLKSLECVDADKVILIGHSEGCILSTHLSHKINVAGLILLSGAGVSLTNSMENQLHDLIDEINTLKGFKGFLLKKILTEKKTVGKQKKLFERVLSTNEDVIKVQMRRFPAKWLREHLAYTDDMMLDLLSKCEIPVLALTGDKDVQTNSNQLVRVIDLNNANIEVNIIPNMDHMLKYHDGKKSLLEVKKQYKQGIKKPIHQTLSESIKKWCKTNHFL